MLIHVLCQWPRRVMGSACGSCWTGARPPRCWAEGSGCRRSTSLPRWTPLDVLSCLWIHRMQGCDDWHRIWHFWCFQLFEMTMRMFEEGNTECVAALLAVGANVRAVNARGQVLPSLLLWSEQVCSVRFAPRRPRSKPWDAGASTCKRFAIALGQFGWLWQILRRASWSEGRP